MTATTLVSASSPATAASRGLRVARAMYAANVVGAGLPGLVMTVAPTFAAEQMFAGDQDPVTFGILGAIWLSIGAVSVLGLRDPRRYLGVFVVQALYKTIWIATGALPLVALRPDVAPFAIGFAVVTVGFAAALVLTGTGSESRR